MWKGEHDMAGKKNCCKQDVSNAVTCGRVLCFRLTTEAHKCFSGLPAPWVGIGCWKHMGVGSCFLRGKSGPVRTVSLEPDLVKNPLAYFKVAAETSLCQESKGSLAEFAMRTWLSSGRQTCQWPGSPFIS